MHVGANNVFIEIRAVQVQKEDLFHLAAYALCMHCKSLLRANKAFMKLYR